MKKNAEGILKYEFNLFEIYMCTQPKYKRMLLCLDLVGYKKYYKSSGKHTYKVAPLQSCRSSDQGFKR